jgi:hypothetical protein
MATAPSGPLSEKESGSWATSQHAALDATGSLCRGQAGWRERSRRRISDPAKTDTIAR